MRRSVGRVWGFRRRRFEYSLVVAARLLVGRTQCGFVGRCCGCEDRDSQAVCVGILVGFDLIPTLLTVMLCGTTLARIVWYVTILHVVRKRGVWVHEIGMYHQYYALGSMSDLIVTVARLRNLQDQNDRGLK